MARPSTKGKNQYSKSDRGKGKEEPLRIEPLFNDVFIRVFGSSESKTLTRSFVNAILRAAHIEEIGEIEDISAEESDIGGSVECRSARYDVRIVSGKHILDLEAQRTPEDIANRSLFYGAKLLASAAKKGMKFDDMPYVTIITLLDTRPLFDDDQIIRSSCIDWQTEDGHTLATNHLRFVLVELAKVRERYNSLSTEVLSDEALAWLYVITTGFEKEASVQQVAETFPTIEEFATLYGYAIDDPKITVRYDLFEESWREEQSRQKFLDRIRREGVEEGVEQGLSQGIEQGRHQGLSQGIEQGVEQGIKQGAEQAIREMSEQLQALGVDTTLIKEAAKASRAHTETAEVSTSTGTRK